MIIEYRISPKEAHEAIEKWLCEKYKVKQENIVSILLNHGYDKEEFVITVDTDKRYPGGLD